MGNRVFRAFVLMAALIGAGSAFAARGGGGGWSLGANIGITAADQKDLDTLVTRSNQRAGGITTGQLGNAWEGNGYISYRFGGMTAIQLRIGFLYQNEDGSDTSGNNYEYGLFGFTIFPMFRFYLLEDTMIKFYTQLGLGWGSVSGDIKEGNNSVEFSGSALGYMGGIGAEFCFWSSSHCITVEGNLRILGVERLIADSVSGDFLAGPPSPASLSQAQKGKEVELDGRDLGVTLSGIEGFIGYVFYF
ncbi:MAG: outer membrane beta-barrel protein [Bdellovibrionaceae bacterium]|nr:outer membrane beta-barrel protein [Bdellovibrionales bacterium]MCB9086410.1 outer membrane beta-barrel protein [Pseudobdellovibrionaceae bacterium]